MACVARPAVAAELVLDSCRLTALDGLVNRDARCGELVVAENPEEPLGRQISLRVAVFRATAPAAATSPVVYFAGGPGQSAIEAFPAALGALAETRFQHDIVLIDQRGTGGSNPLRCPSPDDFRELLRRPSPAEIATASRECLAGLDGDTRFYTTAHAANDVEQVRRALGYGEVNLYGVSYGTRLAQVYLNRFPDRVRSMVLDGVVPTDLVLGTEHAANLESALTSLFDRCEADRDCAAAFPGVLGDYRTLVSRVRSAPTSLQVVLPRSGEKLDLEFNRELLALVLRLLAYAPESQAILPLLVHEALEGLGDSIYRGLEASVMCAEDAPFYPENPADSDTLMGSMLVEVSRLQCAQWPVGEVPEDFHQPFTSTAPTLLLSGEFDPVTPPAYGERALAQYPGGRHLVVSGQGHGVGGRGCLPRLLARFFEQASGDDMDTSCLDDLGETPFFTTLLGSEP
jgi:pimeloyl-ACP methyl ester carboxylesterase